MKSHVRALAAAAALSIGVLLPVFGVGTTMAYNPSAAAAWADQHDWLIQGCDPSKSCNGCTDFVSQALAYGGGYQMVNVGGDMRDYHNWWEQYYPYIGWGSSWSWRVAPYQYDFQIVHNPGGWVYATVPGTTTTPYDNIYTGDELFYDFGWGDGIDHVTIQVGVGYDYQYGRYGDYIDADNRYHAFWSLYDQNTRRNLTTIYEMHIYPGN